MKAGKQEYANVTVRSVIVILLSIVLQSNAQVYYTTKPDYLKVKTGSDNFLSSFKNRYPDSTVNNLAHFHPRNFMGNTGLSSPDYLLTFGSDDAGFRLFRVPLSADMISDKQVEFYQSEGPYALLNGIAGQRQLQAFRMLFTHTLNKRLNIALRFNRYTSLGFYDKQQSYANNFCLSSNYTDSSGSWGYYAYVLNNGNRFQENGGIKNSVLNDSTRAINKELFAVNTYSASRQNKELKFMLNPWIRLKRTVTYANTINRYLQFQSTINNQSYLFKDNNIFKEKFYRNYYHDSLKTRDSLHLRQFINSVYYSQYLKTGGSFSAGYKNEINQLWQKSDSVFLNHVLVASALKEPLFNDSLKNKGLQNFFSAQYIISGAMKGNYKVENRALYYINHKKQFCFGINVLAESRRPDYIYNNWNSNHFLWQNNGYKNQENIQAEAILKFSSTFSVSVMYQNIFRFLYFDEYALPRQYDKTIENLALSAGFSKVFFRHLGVLISHTFQQSNREVYYRLAPNITTARLFYSGNLLRNNLQLQFGAQSQWYQSFTSYAYMPATQTFYLQNNYQTAATPFIDVYFNARIRPVSIFVKLENLLQGSTGTNYSFVAGYHQNDRALRFGITWLFFD